MNVVVLSQNTGNFIGTIYSLELNFHCIIDDSYTYNVLSTCLQYLKASFN